jgi:hypothetical protein
MEITKIDDRNYMIHQRVGGTNTKCCFVVPEIASPFGIETFNNVNYINFAIDTKIPYHAQLLGDLYKTDRAIQEYLKDQGVKVEWVSSVKKNDRFDALWKTRLPKRRGRIETIFRVNGKHVCMGDVDVKETSTVKVCVHSIWVYNGKAGILCYVDEISQRLVEHI